MTIPHAPHITNTGYDSAAQQATVSMRYPNGALSQLTVPMTQVLFQYYQTVAQDVATRVVASGKLTLDNGNQYAENAQTASMTSLLRVHALGIDVPSLLKQDGVYPALIDASIKHQSEQNQFLAEELTHMLVKHVPREHWKAASKPGASTPSIG